MKPINFLKRHRVLIAPAVAVSILAIILVAFFQPLTQPVTTVVHASLWNGTIRVPPGGVVEKPAAVPEQASWSHLEGNFTRVGHGNVISMRVLDLSGNILERFGPGNFSGWGFSLSYRPGQSLYIRFLNIQPIVSGLQKNYTSNDVYVTAVLSYSYQKPLFEFSVRLFLSLAQNWEIYLSIPVAILLTVLQYHPTRIKSRKPNSAELHPSMDKIYNIERLLEG